MTAGATTFRRGRRMGATLCSNPTDRGRCKSGRCWPTAAIRNSSPLPAAIPSRIGAGNRFFVVTEPRFLISQEDVDFEPTQKKPRGIKRAMYRREKYEDKSVNLAMGCPTIRAECDSVPGRMPQENSPATTPAAAGPSRAHRDFDGEPRHHYQRPVVHADLANFRRHRRQY